VKCHEELSNLGFVGGLREEHSKKWDMPVCVPSARYSLVKGERIVRSVLSTRLAAECWGDTSTCTEEVSCNWQPVWDKSEHSPGIPISQDRHLDRRNARCTQTKHELPHTSTFGCLIGLKKPITETTC
jgi:hypothetical protein